MPCQRGQPGEGGAERGVSEQFSFDDEWVAAAQHHEASVARARSNAARERRAHRRARRHSLLRNTLRGAVIVLGFLVGFVWFVVTANSRSTPSGAAR